MYFAPDEHGYIFTLPDGVESRLRYVLSEATPAAQIRVANRDFKLPTNHCLKAATLRTIQRFAKPGRKLVRSETAKSELTGMQTYYNVKGALAADEGNDTEAAMWGICPWKLGVLTGLHVPFDVFVGNPSLGADNSDENIEIPVTLVRRARRWLDCLIAFRKPLRNVQPGSGNRTTDLPQARLLDRSW